MDIKSLEQLQKPDDRALYSTPYGSGSTSNSEAAAVYHQQVMARFDLAEAVPDQVRNAYDQVRTVYSHGVLCYDLYACAHDRARLTLEYALRERFLDYYAGTVVFRDAADADHVLHPATYDELYETIKGRLQYPHHWQLRADTATSQLLSFDGMLTALLMWARDRNLLHGQHNRNHETLLTSIRNRAAHATGYRVLDPGYAAMAIADLAEIINRLWGVETQGGRLYDAPVRRAVTVIAWNKDGCTWNRAELFNPGPISGKGEVTCVVVRAGENDDGLSHFDAQYEATRVPCELLWGPCTPQEAMAWFEQYDPGGDEVSILDRLFMVRFYKGRLYLPRKPEIAAALEPSERWGRWYLVRADSPFEVFNHLRQLLAKRFGCTKTGHCQRPGAPCSIETLEVGTWQRILDTLADHGTPATPLPTPDIHTPMSFPRWNEIGEGTWSVPRPDGH